MRVVWLVLAAACYQAPALDTSSCTVRCTDACPDGTSCVGGYCVAPGETCVDAGVPAADHSCVGEVALGRRHVCVRKLDGTVWCAGSNSSAQLGTGMIGTDTASFVQVVDASGPIADATALGAGRLHSCAVRAGGTVSCWGDGEDGELGNNTFVDTPTAVQVIKADATPLTDIVAVAPGDAFTCAVDSAGAVWCWGRNGSGQLGDNTGVARGTAGRVLSPAGTPIATAAALSVGRHHACVTTTASELWCWGRNAAGVLGTGNEINAFYAVAINAGSIAEITPGTFHTCARNTDGTASCWGSYWQDRLGNASDSSSLTPTPVLVAPGGEPLAGIAQVAVGSISCARMTDASVWCWGANTHGQHGNGAGSRVPAPVLLDDGTPLTGVDHIAAGYAHACAVRGGEILCWGRGTEGELGDGRFENIAHPRPLGLSCP